MNPDPQDAWTPPGARARSGRAARTESAVAIALAAVAVLALLLRIPSIAQPLGIDQSLWASAVRGMARGQLLYADVWEQRPPGIYWIYLAAFQLLGWRPSTVAWIDIAAAVATTVLTFAIARCLASRTTAAAAAALYAVFTMPAWLYGYGGFLERAINETFIVPCVCAGVLAAVRLREGPSIAAATVMGFFAGAAVVLKPNAGLYLPAMMMWVWFYRDGGPRARLRPWLPALAAMAAGAAVLPGAALVWLWRLDLLAEARTAVIDFNRFYVGEGFVLSDYAMLFSKAIWLRVKTEPLWLAGTAGGVVAVWDLARQRTLPALAGLGVIWGGAAALVMIANGARLFNSYFINAFVPLALMGAWVLSDAPRGSRPRQALAAVLLVVTLMLLVQRDYAGRVFGSVAADVAALRGRLEPLGYLERFGGYGRNTGYSARANAELAEYIREHTNPDERIFLFGINGAGVYFAADRLSAHRFLRVNFFVETEFPDPRFRLEAVIGDLQRARPRYIIFERLHGRLPMHRIADALPSDPRLAPLLRHYHEETTIEDFTIFRRLD